MIYRQTKLRRMRKMNKTNSKTHFFLIPIGVFLCQERERKQIFFKVDRENKQGAQRFETTAAKEAQSFEMHA